MTIKVLYRKRSKERLVEVRKSGVCKGLPVLKQLGVNNLLIDVR